MSIENNKSGVPYLRRNYGITTASALVVANMVGAGIFITSGLMTKHLPDPLWILFCWVLGGLIATAGALSYAELATRMPKEGGEYVYLKELYHPSLGFLTGWTSLVVGFSVPIALSGMGFSAYLFAGLEHHFTDLDSIGSTFYQKLLAILLIVFFTFLHYVGGRIGPLIQNILTFLKILLIAGLATLGLLFGKGDWSNFTVVQEQSFDLMAFGTAMMMVMYAYSGWNASAYIAGELKHPSRTIPISLIGGTAVVMLMYLFINIFYFYASPIPQLKGTITVGEVAVANAFGTGVSDFLGLMIGAMLLSSLSAFIMIGPRVYYAMARDGLFPGFASKIHPHYKVPSLAILVQGSIAIFMVIIGSFEQLLIYVGFALGIFPWLAVIGLFKERRLKIGEDTAVQVFTFAPIFFLTASLFVMTVAFINSPVESIAAIVTVLAGIPCYYLWVMYINNSKTTAKDT